MEDLQCRRQEDRTGVRSFSYKVSWNVATCETGYKYNRTSDEVDEEEEASIIVGSLAIRWVDSILRYNSTILQSLPYSDFFSGTTPLGIGTGMPKLRCFHSAEIPGQAVHRTNVPIGIDHAAPNFNTNGICQRGLNRNTRIGSSQ